MKFSGRVTQLISGAERCDKIQLAVVTVDGAVALANNLWIPNAQGLELDQAVTVTIEAADHA